ncbi:MAG: HAD hydrolase family protein [Lachnospiraceae bacterium]|nr:HAD hydrolase family protein [Ruminococcus sp.]MCM1274586.1 HAD hydrolase family protein [Lachnospiraceae bacterium]
MTLYVTDLDGTLLRSDTSLSEYSVDTLNALMGRGVMFTYATARSFASASPLVSGLALSCPAIVFNGVFIIDPRTGERIIENVYSDDCRNMAKELFIRENIAPLVYSFIDGEERVSYLESRLDDVKGYVNSRRGDKRLRPVSGWGALFEGDIFYFTVIDPRDTAPLDRVFIEENGFARNVQRDTYDDMIWYEIYDKGASKANAARQLAELVNADELVCFGDNFNDISMIRAADTGAAVANAVDELKRAADIIIGGNDDDGVARFIEKRGR